MLISDGAIEVAQAALVSIILGCLQLQESCSLHAHRGHLLHVRDEVGDELGVELHLVLELGLVFEALMARVETKGALSCRLALVELLHRHAHGLSAIKVVLLNVHSRLLELSLWALGLAVQPRAVQVLLVIQLGIISVDLHWHLVDVVLLRECAVWKRVVRA